MRASPILALLLALSGCDLSLDGDPWAKRGGPALDASPVPLVSADEGLPRKIAPDGSPLGADVEPARAADSAPARASDALPPDRTKVDQAPLASPDTLPPSVKITAPAQATTYSTALTVQIVASASDDRGVTKVVFYEGSTLKGSDTSPPYSYSWSVTAAVNGTHSWTAKAYDAAGNSTSSAPLALTVSIPTTAPGPTAPFGSTVGMTAANFDITDCNGAPFVLHDQWGKYPAVVVMLNWTGFTWSTCTGASSWLSGLKTKYPQDLIVEVKQGTTPIESSVCNQWVTQFGSKQLLLRDNGDVKTHLAMTTYDVVVMDRDLKIRYRNSVWAANAQAEVTSLLATLK